MGHLVREDIDDLSRCIVRSGEASAEIFHISLAIFEMAESHFSASRPLERFYTLGKTLEFRDEDLADEPGVYA